MRVRSGMRRAGRRGSRRLARRVGSRTLKRTDDVRPTSTDPATSGPTEAINGRLEHLRGSALGFRNLTNYEASQIAARDRRFQTSAEPLSV